MRDRFDIHNLNLFYVLFQTLIFRYTGKTDLSIHTLMLWPKRNIENSNTLEVKINKDFTIKELLKVSESDLSSFPKILGTDIEGCKVVFSWNESDLHSSEEPVEAKGSCLSMAVHFDSGQTFTLNFFPAGPPAYFSEYTDFISHANTLLASMRDFELMPVGIIPIMELQEAAQISEWSHPQTVAEILEGALLHQLFEAQVKINGENVAIDFGSVQWSYRELEEQSNRIAHFLQSQEIGQGSFVGLLMEKSPMLYAGMLGILKAGAAYVPIDPKHPADLIEFIAKDASLEAILVSQHMKLNLPTPTYALENLPAGEPLPSGVTKDDVCYVIYTSGSTGYPKGVQVQHKSVSHLVQAESLIYSIEPKDRVYQGLSMAFDAAVEEVWLAFNHGATLVPATPEMQKAGPHLPKLLTEAKITVLSTVPTLLALIPDDLPTVRLLIVGGESCPNELGARWCKPGRRLFNTYGPTEATVIATYAELFCNQPVTIGKPVPNYTILILDEEMQPVPIGVAGEICIGGPGVAKGYLNQEQLTEEKFRDHQHPKMRLYKSGDMGRFNQNGEIEYLGRRDTQIKIHGFRVDLAQIEAVLMQCPGVAAAAVTLREDSPGIKELAAYFKPKEGALIKEKEMIDELRLHLPFYMIPSILYPMEEIPTLPSGKVNKRALPAPEKKEPLGKTSLIDLWRALFYPKEVGLDDDFFTDLNGHSLLAAHLVSELRKDPHWKKVSILDIYNYPTIAKLTKHLERLESEKEAPKEEVKESSGLTYWLCAFFQLLSFYPLIGFGTLQWITPYFTFVWLHERHFPLLTSILAALGTVLLVYPFSLLAGLLVKWIVIGRYKAGEHPVWGQYYFRWWFVNKVLEFIPLRYLAGSQLLNIYYRLMGAKIGSNVYLGSEDISCFDLISIGDHTHINEGASLCSYTIENGHIRFGSIHIGKRVCVQASTLIRENCTIADDVVINDLTMIPPGSHLAKGTSWVGSPAEQDLTLRDLPEDQPGKFKRMVFGFLHGIALLIFPLLPILAAFPGIMLLNRISHIFKGHWYLAATPLVALIFILLLALEIVIVKWALIGRVKEGAIKIHSFFYLRKWFVDQLMNLSLDLLGPLYSTMYLAPWYRLLGARIGKHAEISTAQHVSTDLLTLGDGSFVADSVSLGAPLADRGYLHLHNVSVGKKSFVGNSAVLPTGAVIGDDCLVGCLSTIPKGDLKANTSWLGSPARVLPTRQESAAFAEETTFKPTKKLIYQRAFIEYFRVTLPATFIVLLICLLLSVMTDFKRLPLYPLLFAVMGAGAYLIHFLFKWILIGKYIPQEQPLWSPFVWKTELMITLYENLASPFLLNYLTGTPFLAFFLKGLGVKIGKRVYLESGEITEFDLVTIEDGAEINSDATLQTHLFEDRVMKMSRVHVGKKCHVGGGSLILYDTVMEEGSSLGYVSLLMKGEVLPPWTSWEGTPCRPVKR
jgi:non-ribosomal peptide synthetase-like protein